MIQFRNQNSTWVMRITADRTIEVNEDVRVTEAAKKVLEAMQGLLDAPQPAHQQQAAELHEALADLVEAVCAVPDGGWPDGFRWASVRHAKDALAWKPTQRPAPVQQEQCPTCGEFEPRTGTCGASPNDKLALCNRNAPQPAQRKPLTPEWIWAWLMDWCKRNGTSPASYNSLFKLVSDARAIEAAHSIKENT